MLLGAFHLMTQVDKHHSIFPDDVFQMSNQDRMIFVSIYH